MSALNGAQWILLGFFALSAVVKLLLVGKDRSPITPQEATISTILTVVCMWLVVEAGS